MVFRKLLVPGEPIPETGSHEYESVQLAANETRIGGKSFRSFEIAYVFRQSKTGTRRIVDVYTKDPQVHPYGLAMNAHFAGCGGVTLVRVREDVPGQIGCPLWFGTRVRMFLPGQKVETE